MTTTQRLQTFSMPDVGEGLTEAEVLQWRVAVGDTLAVNQVIVEMDHGYLFVTSISDGSVLGVLTGRDADLAAVGYETTLLVDRVGSILTPEIVAELKGGLSA